MDLITITISAIFVNNFVLSRFLGLCPFMGVSKEMSSAIGMGLAVIFVMTLATALTNILYVYVLVPWKLEFLRTIVFILIIASLVQMVEIVLHKTAPALYKALGIYLPLITTNCAILGATVLAVMKKYNFVQSTVFGFMSGVGFTLALVLMAGIREKLELAKVPKAFKGTAIALITAALMSLAFMGFAGMIKE